MLRSMPDQGNLLWSVPKQVQNTDIDSSEFGVRSSEFGDKVWLRPDSELFLSYRNTEFGDKVSQKPNSKLFLSYRETRISGPIGPKF